MILSARKLIEQVFTTAAVNAQITAINTALSVTGSALAAVQNGWQNAPKDGSSFPCLTYWVGDGPVSAEIKRMGKRDVGVAVRLLYLSRHATIAESEEDIEVALEAMLTLVETLHGLQYGATGRYVVDERDMAVEFMNYSLGGEVVRHGGELRFTLLMRTEGLT